MEWTADVRAGDWLRELVDDPWQGTMHGYVPRGFAAYARIFHPATRDRPVGAEWPRAPYSDPAWHALHIAHPALEIVDERVSWAQVAAVMGTVMHPGAQWGALTRLDPHAPHREDDPRDADGWRYQDPEQGGMPPDQTAAIARVLAGHTAAPDAGYIALWEGWAGLLGFMGARSSRGFYQIDDGRVSALSRHNEMLGRSFTDLFNNVFRRATWQEGILSREISQGERLDLPARGHVLFRGGIAELTDPDWVLHVPWRDRETEAHGGAPDAQSPSIVWPDDHAWVVVTDVDLDSTIVGGSPELIAALIADPALEALRITEGTVLTYDVDEVNR